jgi:TP901 family phage tail tape measure protein
LGFFIKQKIMAVATMRVPTIFTAVDRFSSVVSRMSMSASAFGKSAEAAAMRTSRKFNSMGNSMLTTGVAIATGIGYAVNEAAKFEKSMANISTLTENSPAEMKKMGDAILNMSKKIPVTLSDLSIGGYDVVSAGITGTSNQLNVLEESSMLAVAGLGKTKEAVDVLTSSLNAFDIDASKSYDVTNKLMKAVKYGKLTISSLSESFGKGASMVRNANVSLEEYLAGTAALTTTGMTASQGQNQFVSAIGALIKPSGVMSKIFEKLGVKDVPKWIKANGGLGKSIEIVADKAKEMNLLTSKAFGRKEGYSALLSLLGAQKEKFSQIMVDMLGGADILYTALGEQNATLTAKIQLMKNRLTILAITIGDVLLPKIEDLFNWIGNISTNVSSWAEKNSFLVDSLYFVAKWLLIVGIYLKAGAFLFYGISKAIAFATWVSEVYTTVTRLLSIAQLSAAISGESLAIVLGELALESLAAYWTVLVVVGALGLLTYAFWDIGESAEDSSTKQINALMEQNKAYMSSTNVLSTELQKQATLINNHNAKVLSPKQLVSNIINKEVQRKQEVLSNRDLLKPKEIKPLSEGLMSKLNENYKIDQAYGISTRQLLRKNGLSYGEIMSSKENLAGKSDNEKFFNFIKNSKGELVVNVKVKGGEVESIDDSNAKGLPVKVTSTKTTTKK